MSCDFLQKVEKTIDRHSMLQPGIDPVIVAFSGGADSVALLASLVALGYRCVAAHCNFQLRGAESVRDRDFAFSMAARLGVEFREITFNVEQRMAQTGESTEMACRELRYEWFALLKNKYNAQAVATGHHCGDNIETMFLNLLRGTGLQGAAGIVAVADRRVSPLIDCSRKEIIEYLELQGLDYVVDSTNLENKYQRNKIRNVVLPVLTEEFPQAETSLATSLRNLDEDRELMEYFLQQQKEKYFISSTELDVAKIAAQEPMAEALLFRLLKQFGFNRLQTDSILNASSGSIFESGSWRGVLSRGIFELSKRTDGEKRLSVCFDVLDRKFFKPSANPGEAWFSTEILSDNPTWELRCWQKGDRMKPFGMNGRSKKLSDIFNDMKLPDSVKHEHRVLLRNGEIVWVIGVRNSNLFRVGDSDSQVVRLTAERE